VQPGEQPQEALFRELREELGVSGRIGTEIYRTRHRYAELTRELELIFYSTTLGPEPLENLAFERVVWAERERLKEYDFLPAAQEAK
jgi:8-oxo-dGTP pyrophosphatase MutT (NUDIX family)